MAFCVIGCDASNPEIPPLHPRSTSTVTTSHGDIAGFVFLDWTKSGDSFAVPAVTVAHIEMTIDAIAEKGGGILLLNYVDENSSDNIPLKIYIPGNVLMTRPILREQQPGEVTYKKVRDQYRSDSASWINDSLRYIQSIHTLKEEVQTKVKQFLDDAKHRGILSLKSDVIGVLNYASVWFESIETQYCSQKLIIAVSDLHDNAKKELHAVSPDVKIYQICNGDKPQGCVDADFLPFYDQSTIKQIFQHH